MGYTGPKVFRIRKTAEEIADDAVELEPLSPLPSEPDKYPIRAFIDDTPKPKEGDFGRLQGRCKTCLFCKTARHTDMFLLTLQVRTANGGRVLRACMGFGAVADHVRQKGRQMSECTIEGVWRISDFNSPHRRWVLFVKNITFAGKQNPDVKSCPMLFQPVLQRAMHPTAQMLDRHSEYGKSKTGPSKPRRISKRDLDKLCKIFES
jgi:hypothetical protein